MLNLIHSGNVQLLYEMILVGKIDLHMHTTASDGTDTPAELADKLCATGLKTVALTDHDTFAGIPLLKQRLAEIKSMGNAVPKVISGVELSVKGYGRELHLLAYYPAGGSSKLQPYLDQQLLSRKERNIKLCAKLSALGYDITPGELEAEARGRNAGRPHAARILVRKGYFKTIREAFDKLLADNQNGYVPRHNPPIEEALRVVNETGGVTVLAHPANYGWVEDEDLLYCCLNELKQLGLAGVEVIHGETSFAESKVIKRVAEKLDLLKTCGSDYHGMNKIDVPLFTAETDFAAYLE